MLKTSPNKIDVVEAIRRVAGDLDRRPSKSEFIRSTGISEYHILRHFLSWNDAVLAAGLPIHSANQPVSNADLLRDWGEMVRRDGRIPTRSQYRREGKYGASTFDKHIGIWSQIPARFRDTFEGDSEWRDVLSLLPTSPIECVRQFPSDTNGSLATTVRRGAAGRYAKLESSPVYGAPMDFRGLRHEPVNEQGVVFLFGVVARELGYLVEAVQTGFPDCEAKRQIAPEKWQRVRIEFEFESRNYNHPVDGCDVIVCWRHNWPECPRNIEVLELRETIRTLANSDD